MDIWTKKKRSYVMSRIVSKGTKPEIIVGEIVKRIGFKFSANLKSLPGTPDLVFPRKNKIIFVHGCFWHQHKNCIDGKLPKSRKKYWIEKMKNNLKRDRRNERRLRLMGWKIIRLWECQVIGSPEKTRNKIETFLKPVLKTRLRCK